MALKVLDLVLAEEQLDAAREALHGLVLGAQERGQVELDARHLDPALGKVVLGEVEEVRVVEHGLGRDAAHVEARTAQLAARLDAGSLQAQLGGLDRGDVATGTAADNDNVELVWFVCIYYLFSVHRSVGSISLPVDEEVARDRLTSCEPTTCFFLGATS